ncbi:mitochondrial inner membrane protease subunit 2-like isoform X2 [Panonychus citri]|uniref:mitochondrial inner membrane protease subunit 2-like isoform X2 n=1 Tax=Panonychus citri TaxID=50023 RepID=UPI002308157B|nr:mitochondrial inner membrane protease subunit 2-like isoform X2 [Panonychus citri]
MESAKYLVKKLSFIIPIGLTLTDRVVTIAQVDGESMQPAFNPKTSGKVSNDVVLINRWSARNFQFKPGDIIEIKSPKNAKQRLIKRIIALEGEWIQPRSAYQDELVFVPKGHCWIEGDNHARSNDSNHFGVVPIGLTRGIISYIIWPPSRWSSVDSSLTIETIKRRSTDGLMV